MAVTTSNEKTTRKTHEGWVAREGQAMEDDNKQTELSTSCDLKTPCTLEHILTAVCEKYIFICSSARRKHDNPVRLWNIS